MLILYTKLITETENPNEIEEEPHEKTTTLAEDDEFYQAFISAIKQKSLPNNNNNHIEENNEVLIEELPSNKAQRDFLSEEEDMGEYVKADMDEVGDDYFTKQRKLAEKKDLKPTDHSKLFYEPFRKNFYIESKEISSLNIDEKVNLRKELGDIKVRGKNCPAPISNWYQCGLSDKILKILLEKRKFGKPFPIQCQVFRKSGYFFLLN